MRRGYKVKRDFLEGLKLDAATIDAIMTENGKDIEHAKAKYADYEDLQKQLATANETLEKFKDYDQTKADVEKFKAELEKSQKESAAKIAAMERTAKVTDFLTGKKFVNAITQTEIKKQLADALADEKNAGKNLDDLFAEINTPESNILQNENKPTPPVVAPMKGAATDTNADINAAREVMGLPPLGKE